MVAAWRRAWTQVIPFFAFPPEIRRLIYTTNALESVHAQLRKIIKTRGHFPNDDAATKLWLALRNITAKWERAAPSGNAAMNQFAILYGDRFLPSRRRKMHGAHGRCRPYGRTERVHSDLENRTERGFPQRPHASSFIGSRREDRNVNHASHTKFLTLPPRRVDPPFRWFHRYLRDDGRELIHFRTSADLPYLKELIDAGGFSQ